ncbi:hypothetical protein JD79_03384 [Geodermatophilus normandii]|uniref:Uncharacterized protein n=1 Tax=Geodermatophilus normandii TaxID=1137989 RepID=A0A317QN64_9ACTN|nr:hypothetical protein JD79_03384 [Geodermatophilus normandii]
MRAQVPAAVTTRVDVGRPSVGAVSPGDLEMGRLRVDDARGGIRSGRALSDVEVGRGPSGSRPA